MIYLDDIITNIFGWFESTVISRTINNVKILKVPILACLDICYLHPKRNLLQIIIESMYLLNHRNERRKSQIHCSFIESLYLLTIWIKRFKTKQTLFHTDTCTHIFLISLVTYHFLS